MTQSDKNKKLSGWLTRARVAVAVGRTVLTGTPSRHFDRVDRGIEIAERSAEIASLVRDILKPQRE